jgi:hypothetical protein
MVNMTLESIDSESLSTVSGGFKWQGMRESTNVEDLRYPPSGQCNDAWPLGALTPMADGRDFNDRIGGDYKAMVDRYQQNNATPGYVTADFGSYGSDAAGATWAGQ